MNERQYHEELLTRLKRIERLLMYIKATIDSPDYNISLTIPQKPDCIGKCQPDLSEDQHKTIPWD